MENIRQAVERVKAHQSAGSGQKSLAGSAVPRLHSETDVGAACGNDAQNQEIELNSVYLQSKRIISHLITDPRSRSFDMLRTQVLQSMDLKGWKTLAVTSPTPACGKTLTALNLAVSIARQPEQIGVVGGFGFPKTTGRSLLGTKV